MARNYKSKTTEQILSSKGFPKPQFTKEELAVIAREQTKLIDEDMKREINDFADKVLKPWFDLSTAAQEAGQDDPVTKAMADLGRESPLRATNVPEFRAAGGPRAALSKAIFSSHCDLTFLTPPYPPDSTFGGPSPEQVGADVEGLGLGYKTRSMLAIPAEGVLSVGVANGRHGNLWTYPSADRWRYGDANSAGANILYIVDVPYSPFPVYTRMEVAIDVTIGDGSPYAPIGLIRGFEDSIGYGVVGVMGIIHLTLVGSMSDGGPRKDRKKFLCEWGSASTGGSDSAGTSVYENNFSLSATLGMKPGATWSAVTVAVNLLAFRAGVDDPSGGWSGVDLRTPDVPTSDIWFGRRAGGPIRIPQMSISFCQHPVFEE